MTRCAMSVIYDSDERAVDLGCFAMSSSSEIVLEMHVLTRFRSCDLAQYRLSAVMDQCLTCASYLTQSIVFD
jgi:hypothetical protein